MAKLKRSVNISLPSFSSSATTKRLTARRVNARKVSSFIFKRTNLGEICNSKWKTSRKGILLNPVNNQSQDKSLLAELISEWGTLYTHRRVNLLGFDWSKFDELDYTWIGLFLQAHDNTLFITRNKYRCLRMSLLHTDRVNVFKYLIQF